jgi:hypothetical protein
VAIGALALVTLRAPRAAFLIWNIVGMLDILLVVALATSLRMSSPEALDALTQLPLSFLPTMLVPLIIASHLILFWRFAKNSRKENPSQASPEVLSAPGVLAAQGEADPKGKVELRNHSGELYL